MIDEILKEMETRHEACVCGKYHCVVCGNATDTRTHKHEYIPRFISALRKAIEQRYSRATSLEHHDEWKARLDAELAAILRGER